MDSELDLEKEEEIEAPVADKKEDAKETLNTYLLEAENDVMDIIAKNIFDSDLKISLQTAVSEHFMGLKQNPSFHSDKFRIPDLNQALWVAFRNYEDYIYKNKIQNAGTDESGRILREYVIPKITDLLWKKDIEITTTQ